MFHNIKLSMFHNKKYIARLYKYTTTHVSSAYVFLLQVQVEAVVTETGAPSAKAGDPIAARFLQILRSDTGPDKGLELIKHRGGDGTGLAHFRDADFVFNRNHAASAAPS